MHSLPVGKKHGGINFFYMFLYAPFSVLEKKHLACRCFSGVNSDQTVHLCQQALQTFQGTQLCNIVEIESAYELNPKRIYTYMIDAFNLKC